MLIPSGVGSIPTHSRQIGPRREPQAPGANRIVRFRRPAVAPADGKIIGVERVPQEEYVEGPATRVSIFLSVLESAGHVDDNDFANAIRLLAENSRLAALPAIAARFTLLKQEAEGSIEVQVVSAQTLSDEQRQQIAASMAKRLGKQVSLSAVVDESLIAGAVITAGDLVIDGSASGRIEKLVQAVNR